MQLRREPRRPYHLSAFGRRRLVLPWRINALWLTYKHSDVPWCLISNLSGLLFRFVGSDYDSQNTICSCNCYEGELSLQTCT
jgi:hypothetical protein